MMKNYESKQGIKENSDSPNFLCLRKKMLEMVTMNHKHTCIDEYIAYIKNHLDELERNWLAVDSDCSYIKELSVFDERSKTTFNLAEVEELLGNLVQTITEEIEDLE